VVKADNAVRTGRLLIGTPYAEIDCINFLKKIIRTSFGGVPGYTTAGTNALWNSYNSAAKYRDLTWRQEGIAGAKAGMLAFKRDGSDVHHVGLVTGMGTVLHSSSTNGGRGVVETPLSASEGWNLLAKHRYIEAKEDANMIEINVPQNALYRAKVITQNDPLSVREWAETGTIIGKVQKDRIVEVLSDAGDGWPKIRYNELVGYASGRYLEKIADEDEPVYSGEVVREEAARPVYIVDSAGNRFQPVGDFKVYFDSID
jgi:hypothetical protein